MDVADIVEIQQLCYAYAVHVDNGDIDKWAELFAPGAPLDETEWSEGLKTGPDEIKAYGTNLAAELEFMFHHVTNVFVSEVVGNKAKGTVFTIVEAKGKSFPRTRFHPIYQDEYVKIDGAWRFAARRLRKAAEAEVVPEPTEAWSRD